MWLSTLEIGAAQKSRRQNRSSEWTEVLSGSIFVVACTTGGSLYVSEKLPTYHSPSQYFALSKNYVLMLV